jgi:hypothetical protein
MKRDRVAIMHSAPRVQLGMSSSIIPGRSDRTEPGISRHNFEIPGSMRSNRARRGLDSHRPGMKAKA